MKSLTIDIVQKLESALKLLLNIAEHTQEEQLEALDVIESFVDQIDTADDFYKIGGFVIIKPLLNSQYEDIRVGGANLIAELSQNNPFCQEHLLEINVYPRLIELLSETSHKVVCASIHAISCMIRSNEKCLKAFTDLGGLECILGCLQNNHEKVHVKIGFLISALASEFPDIRDQFVELNGIEHLSMCLKPVTDYNSKCENILTALSVLSDCAVGTSKLRILSGNFESIIKTIIESNKQKEDCREIVEHSLSLLVKLRRHSNDDADR